MNKTNITTGFMWKLAERFGAQGVAFLVSVILARIIDPSAYGTIALVTVITTILQVFVDSGMGTALIQKKDADEVDFSSVFYFNIAICAVLYALIYLGAPLVGRFYDDMAIVPLVRALGLTLVISGVRNVQLAYVSRNLMFKQYFFATLGGTITAGAVGIYMAYAGFGVWALVGQQLINMLVGTVLLWLVVKWRPKAVFSIKRLKGLLSFGWKLLVSSLINTVYGDIRQLIIGKMYSSEDLAYYNKGNEWPKLVTNSINSAIDSVLLPTMSKEQDDAVKIKAMTRRAICTSTYVMAPLMIGLAACAKNVVALVLTEKWLPAVPFMQVFCLSYMLEPIHTANLNAIKALGRSDCFLKLEIIKKAVGIIILLSTIWFGVMVMAYSMLLTTVICTLINAYPNKKLLDYSWAEQMKDILPNIALALFMGAAVLLMGLIPLPVWVVLILQIISGAVIYIGLSYLLKLEIFNYLAGILANLLKRKKSGGGA